MFIEKTKLTQEASQSKKLPNFIWAIILALIFMCGGSIIGEVAAIPFSRALERTNFFIANQELIFLLVSLSTFAFISLLVFFRVEKIEKRKISSIGFYKN